MIKIYSVEQARQTILRRETGGEAALPESVQAGIRRVFGEDLTPEAAVARILADVRARGDVAALDWTRRIDGVTLASTVLPPEEIEAAASRIPPDLRQAMQFAAGRIRAFHARQPLASWQTREMGGLLGQMVTPLERIGVYVPGGSAPLPSSLLMAAIPARVAGVKEIVVATPPNRATGRPDDIILAAAHIAGVQSVVCLGGAQAIAALAFGTEAVARVDKIVGPGNLFVTLAKRQVFGFVGLDGLAGPTETVIVADEHADPTLAAADLLAQAEHDVLARPILITPSQLLAEAVQVQVARQIESLSRAEIAAAALENGGGIVLTGDLAEAVRLADEFAPEHLCLSVVDPERWVASITRAGGLFLGEQSFEVLGDYAAGPSHIMPTGGTARYASPLTALDFVRITNIIGLDAAGAAEVVPAAVRLAEAEGLDAHASAARRRLNGEAPARAAQALTVRPEIEAMEAYQPVHPPEVLAERLGLDAARLIKLDANENPYGPSPRAVAALTGAALNIYPDPDSQALRAALARQVNVPEAALLAGAGADELIDLILRAMVAPGEVVLNCPPSFGMYPFSAAVNTARLINVPRRDDFSVDVPAVEAAVATEPKARVLFVCSPNNPDGGVISDEGLRRLLALPLLVVLDEAYVEFEGRSRIEWVKEYANLAVLRTFSKWAGLAGLRVGYGAFPGWLAPHLWKIKQPYNINVAAARAAIASLEDRDYLMQNVGRLTAERERLTEALRQFDFVTPYPSQANFVLCRLAGRTGAEVKQALAAQGVLVRYFDKPGLRDCIRISVGKPEQTEAVIAGLKSLAQNPIHR